MHFTWDKKKAELNWRKHQITFEEAQTTWNDELAVEFYDPDHSEDEDRFIHIGMSAKMRILLIVYTEWDNEDVIRIISARKATPKEKTDYARRIRS